MKKNQKFASSMKIVGGLLTTGLLTVGVVNSPVITKTKNTNTNNKIAKTNTKKDVAVTKQIANDSFTVDASVVFDGTNVSGKVLLTTEASAGDVTPVKIVAITESSTPKISGSDLVLKTNFNVDGVGACYVREISEGAFEENGNILGTLDLSALYTIETTSYGISSIVNEAFAECTGITEVKLPTTITSISSEAFTECTNLVSINLDASTATSVTIGSEAFSECRCLTSVTLPSGIGVIDEDTFEDCTSLTTVDLSKCIRLTSIVDGAFSKCTSLSTIKFPAQGNNVLAVIEQNAFSGCSSLTSLSLASLDQLDTIGENAFKGCSKLHSLTFPSGNKLDDIGIGAFSECDLLFTQINLNGNENYSAITFKQDQKTVGYAIAQQTTTTWEADSVAAGGLAFGVIDLSSTTVTTLATNAFAGSYITDLKLPSTLTTISNNACKNCTKLTTVDFSACIATSGCSIGTDAFIGCNLLTKDGIIAPTDTNCQFKWFNIGDDGYSFGTSAWGGANNAAGLLFGSINFADVSATLGEKMLSGCCGITGVVTGSLTSLPSEIFKDCINLREVELSSSLTEVGEDAFEGCPLTLIESNSTSLPLVQFYNGGQVVGGAIMGSEEEDVITTSWDEESVTVGCLAYGEVVLEGSGIFDTIAEEAFANCDGITAVKLTGIKSIGEEAFEKCDNLTSVSFDDSLIEIEEGAFNECPNLTEITLPSSVELVDSYAFGGCESLTDITFKNKNPEWMAWSQGTATNATSTNKGMSAKCFTGLVEATTSIVTGGISPITNIHVPSGSESKYQKYFENNPSQFGLWYTAGAIHFDSETNPNSNTLALGLGIGLGGAALIGLIVALVIVAKKKKNKKATSKPAANKK